MTLRIALLATAITILPQAALATTYNFVVAPILGPTGLPLSTIDSRIFNFQIGTETPTQALPFQYPNYRMHSYTFTALNSSMVTTVPATLGKNIVFFDTNNQGGLSLTNSGVNNFFVYNTVLYDEAAYRAALLTNPAALPLFNIGTFAVSTTPRNNAAVRPLDNYTVTISTLAAAVPEPATWAMMLLGCGAVGVTLRRRPPQSARA